MKNILLIDDDTDDCLLFEQAMRKVSSDFALSCLPGIDNLYDAIAINQPSMIFIDMQLPKKNGIECLKQIKGHPDFKDIPVVMWSTSHISSYVYTAYREGANYFFQKPCSFSELVNELEVASKAA
ncbi:response regulator [Chitinophagaceae bacterium LB-8]|uniref:Response regulator n=1 Tax=Paraflavisolibacter caeni TaxID=2982496 RepID=A0A9X2Y009_9BACT|nr:response regulator [Paraflavisolibacter caeni]MCU7552581.1 response regulator [Paraflavisolibacter caeni]